MPDKSHPTKPFKGKDKIHSGERYGRLTVIRFSHVVPHGKKYRTAKWLCLCDCGKETLVRTANLRTGTTKSCGCLMRETSARNQLTHGLARVGRMHPVYASWSHAKGRCRNRNNRKYKGYGGRGLIMCAGWLHDSLAFYNDMVGTWKQGLTIGRIDNDLGYHCGKCVECKKHNWALNCRWETAQQQANNTRRNKTLTYDGNTLTYSQWARELHITVAQIRNRVRLKWSVRDILTLPVNRGAKYRLRKTS